jgi:Septin
MELVCCTLLARMNTNAILELQGLASHIYPYNFSKHLSNSIRFSLFIGQTGLGKSTLINTIFASHLIDSKGRFTSEDAVRKTTEIQGVSHGMFYSWRRMTVMTLVSFLRVFLRVTCFGTSVLNSFRKRNDADVYFIVIVENGVRLRLNIVDTPGYGDQVNNEGWCVLISLCYQKYPQSVYALIAGTPLLNTSRTNTVHTCAKNLQPCVTDTSKIRVSIAVCTLSIRLATR